MLPRANRLKIPTSWNRKNPDFQLKTEFFKIIGKKDIRGKSAKIGFIISGKVGKATVRNRLRRRLAALFYTRIADLDPTNELIVIVYPNIAQAKDEEISSSFNKVLPKLHI